ncbi:MAG: beta-propeller fold lactonase family protein [Deltaproteobacteria bacterium]|nr:beta-propeller fold lactonase family protein [Deltaproteobacteria bacterium]
MIDSASQERRAVPRLVVIAAVVGLAVPAAAAPYAYVTLLGADQVAVIDAASNAGITPIVAGDDPNGVAVSPDGTRAYVTGFVSGTLSVIDTATNQAIDSIAVGDGPVGVAVHPDGQRIYVANRREDTLAVVDAAPFALRTRIAVGDGPNAVAIRPDGTTAYVTNSATTAPGEVSVVDLDTGQVRTTLAVNRNPNRVAFTADGRTAIVTSFRNWNATLIDATADRVETALRLGYRPTSVVANPNGFWAYVTDLSAGVLVIDLAERRVTRTLPVGHRPWAIGVQRNGGTGYIANFYDDTVSVVDLAEEVGVAEIAVGDRPFAVAVNCVGSGCSEAPYTPKPTRTPTLTPTGTVVPPTPTPTHGSIQLFGNLSDAAPGDRIEIFINQQGDQRAVSARSDLAFAPGVRIAARPGGEPDCFASVAVDPSRTGFRFLPAGCAGANCTGLRASLTSLGDPLRDGPLYWCVGQVAFDAAAGRRQLTLGNASAATAAGDPIPVFIGSSPSVEVRGEPDVFLVPSQPSGAPGARVSLTITLETRGPTIAGTQNQIEFADGIRVAATANGRPDCRVNPAIDKNGTGFAFSPSGCSGDACRALRSLVLSLDNVDPIPNGSVLYTCTLLIDAAATRGAHTLQLSDVGASDPDGRAIDARGRAATITVLGSTLVARQTTMRDRHVCSGGAADDETCDDDADCRGGACVRPQGMCLGGTDHGLRCDCPGATCEPGGGSASCGDVAEAGTCGADADNRGTCCDRSFNCGADSTCVSTHRLCASGAAKGSPCDSDDDCLASTCLAFARRCAGGLLDGTACVDGGDCPAGECIEPGATATPTATAPPTASATRVPDRSSSSGSGGCNVTPTDGSGAAWLLAPLALLLQRRRRVG